MSFDWLKHYMPRSLYGRAALILVLPVVCLQLVVSVLFVTRHFQDVSAQMTKSVSREIRLALEAVATADSPALIAQAVQARTGALDITTVPVDPVEVPTPYSPPWIDFSDRAVIAELEQGVPGLLAVDLSADRLVRVYAETALGPVRMSFDRRRVAVSNAHQLFVNSIFFGALVTVIAMLYLRNQLRPINRLARAAEAFGKGRHVRYTPAGAVEVRAAGNAFVEMRARIERQIEQRTLMLSGVSHDLRTPLTRMRLSLSMLEDEERAALEQDVDDMQRMLDAFLNFAKGEGEGAPEPVDPVAMVEEAVRDARRQGVDVTLLPPEGEGSGRVTLNPLIIRRAVDNLISNAGRYATRAEVSVLLTDKTLRIRVDDDGPGIPEARRSEAMRPFTRLDPARNLDKGGSVGLGLAIATDAARAHGGILRLGEAEGLGGLRADIVIAR
ncbi:ATP-binding protein [Sulfitobacter sp. LCG007]